MYSFNRCAILAALLVAVGCGRPASDSQHPTDLLYQDKITVGATVWPGYVALYVADDKGFFKEEGLDVEIKHYPGSVQLSKDYLDRQMLGRTNLTLEAVQEHLSGLRHKVVLAIDYSRGSDAILAKPEIQSVADFKGKRVAFVRDGLGEFFIRWALKEHGLTLDDIIPVDCEDAQASAVTLENDKADAAVTFEPSVSRLEATGRFHRVYTSAEAPGLITDILTFRSEFVERHPATVGAFLRAYFKAYQFWEDHPQEANKIVANVFRTHGDPDATPERVAKAQEGMHILDLQDNLNAFSFASGLQSLYGNMRQIHEYVQETTSRSSPQQLVGTDELVEPYFVRELSMAMYDNSP